MWHLLVVAQVLALVVLSHPSRADALSLQGTLSSDDDVVMIPFTLAAPSAVTLRTWSFAGGVNADGDAIAAGGFAPVLSLFDGTGALMALDHNGGSGPCGPRATLIVFVNRIGVAGSIDLLPVISAWTESGVTFNTTPALGATLATLPVAAANKYVIVDVTALVQAWVTDPGSNEGLAFEPRPSPRTPASSWIARRTR